MNKEKFFVVYLCGCTDCFPWAVFVRREDAEDWAARISTNPEGYVVKEQYLENVEWDT